MYDNVILAMLIKIIIYDIINIFIKNKKNMLIIFPQHRCNRRVENGKQY